MMLETERNKLESKLKKNWDSMNNKEKIENMQLIMLFELTDILSDISESMGQTAKSIRQVELMSWGR